MISKDLFIETMNALDNLDNKMGKIELAMHDLCPDFRGFYIHEVFDLVMNIFAEMFDDTDGWLDYFVYENDYMHESGPITIWTNDRPIVIKNWGDVYEFLIKNMEG